MVYGARTTWYSTCAVDSNDIAHFVVYSYKSDTNDFQLEYCRLEIFGICKKCRRNNS